MVKTKYFLQNFLCSYDSSTGVFTVPSGGDGLYYFSTYLAVFNGELGSFNVVVNNDNIICTAYGDHDILGDDYPQAACSAMAQLAEGHFI